MNKQNKFVDWICGVKGAEFPFFKNFQPVMPPIGFGAKELEVKNETPEEVKIRTSEDVVDGEINDMLENENILYGNY